MMSKKLEWVSTEEDGDLLFVDGESRGGIQMYPSGTYEAIVALRECQFPDRNAAKTWVERVATSVEFELWSEMARARKALYEVAKRTFKEPATIELCVFFGKVSAAADILAMLEEAGVPLPDPDEQAHPLEEPIGEQTSTV